MQLVVGYKGLIDLARRSGHITSIASGVHYSDDELWDYEEGTESRLRHKPGQQQGDKLHAYAIARFKDGGHAYVVLPWSRVMKIRNGSQGWQSALKFGKTDASPWAAHEDEMAKKTAVRSLAKMLPLSTEFVDAVTLDGARADYGAFALDPVQGVTIEGGSDEGDDAAAPLAIEAEAQPVVAAAAAQPAPVEAAKPAPRQKAAKAAARPTQQAELAVEVPAAVDDTDMLAARIEEWVSADVADGANLKDTIDFYETQIAAVQAKSPEKADALLARLNRDA